MATILQEKLAQNIVNNTKRKKPLNKRELLVSTGYNEITAESIPDRIIKQKGVQEALEDLGFTEENAMKVVKSIMLNEKVDTNARLKATDQVFKVKGTYAPEKKINANMNVNIDIEEKANEAITRFLNGDTGNYTK